MPEDMSEGSVVAESKQKPPEVKQSPDFADHVVPTPPELQHVQELIKSYVSDQQKEISRIDELLSTSNTDPNYKAALIEELNSLKQSIADYQVELVTPTWSNGIRPQDPKDFVYHGTGKDKLANITITGLIPTPQKENPSKSLLWFGGIESAYGNETDVLLRFPAAVVGKRTPFDGVDATKNGVPAYLIDVSHDRGVTWKPIVNKNS